jgi:hypothetical protein
VPDTEISQASASNGNVKPKKANPDDEEQVLWMGNERFTGPELLFHPSDIGKLFFLLYNGKSSAHTYRDKADGHTGDYRTCHLDDASRGTGDVLGSCGGVWRSWKYRSSRGATVSASLSAKIHMHQS